MGFNNSGRKLTPQEIEKSMREGRIRGNAKSIATKIGNAIRNIYGNPRVHYNKSVSLKEIREHGGYLLEKNNLDEKILEDIGCAMSLNPPLVSIDSDKKYFLTGAGLDVNIFEYRGEKAMIAKRFYASTKRVRTDSAH